MNARCAARSSVGDRDGKRHQTLAHDDRLAERPLRHGGLGKHELRLASADQLDIDFGEKFGVEQGAMLGASRIVDRIPRAEIVQPVRSAGMLAAGNQERIDHAFAREQRPAGALELGVEKSHVECGVMDDQRRVAEKGDQIVGDFREEKLVLEELIAEAVDRERLGRHAALGIEIAVKGLAGRYAVDQLDTADFDQTMAVQGIETRCLGIEHNLAHLSPMPPQMS